MIGSSTRQCDSTTTTATINAVRAVTMVLFRHHRPDLSITLLVLAAHDSGVQLFASDDAARTAARISGSRLFHEADDDHSPREHPPLHHYHHHHHRPPPPWSHADLLLTFVSSDTPFTSLPFHRSFHPPSVSSPLSIFSSLVLPIGSRTRNIYPTRRNASNPAVRGVPMNVGYRSISSFMIPTVVASFCSRHDTRFTATALQLTPRHPRLLPGPTYSAPLFPLAIHCRLFRSPGESKLLNSPSTTRSSPRSPSLVSFHAPMCMRAHARLRERLVGMRLCTCVSTCVCHSVTLSFSLSLSLFVSLGARSLDPCTAASPAPGSCVAAGRHSQDVSLSLAMFRPSNPP